MHIQELVGQTQTALELIGLCGYKNRCSVNDVYEALFLDKSADNLKKIVQTVNNTEVFTLLVNTAFEMAEQMELNTVSAKAIVDEVTAEITPVVVEVVTPVVEPVTEDESEISECHEVTASVAEPITEIKNNQYTRKTSGWVGLHAHSHFSLLDGFRSPTELVTRAKELNQPGIALTDHGGMWGAVELMQAAQKAGIKALPGNEMYLLDAEASRRLKEYSGNGDYRVKERYHQLVLAVSKQGYQNLCQLTTDSYLKNSVIVRKKVYPLITKEELVAKKEGLVLTSGCLAGLVCQGILSHRLEFARSTAQWFKDNFGSNYYIEIQDHGSEDDQRKVNHHLVAIASELSIGLVVTADSHYVTPEQKEAHKAFLRINKGEKFSNVYEGKFWHPSEQEIKERLSYLPEWAVDQAIDNTVLIAQQVEDYTLERKPVSPNYQLPKGYDDADEYLEVLAHQGLVNIKLNKTNYFKRLNYELDILKSKGLSNYFLIVQDYVNWAKEKLIPVGVARGSGGGSLVCYALGITAIDPIKHELIFERFINPERESYPDIDVDFCIERRHEVVDYIRNKYGLGNVANIITFGKLESKSALKDAGWVLGVNYSEQNYYSKQLPVIRGKNTKLSDLISDEKLAPEFYTAYHNNKRLLTNDGELTFQKWVDLAIDLEKTIKSSGVHAAGLVIGDVPLGSLIPLQKNVDGTICTQYGMYQVEWMGFLKMDILGLKNLTILDKAQKWLGRSYYELEQVDLEDNNALSLIASGECEGIFQLESSSAVGLINLIKPTAFSEVADITSLNRPGCLDLGMHYKYASVKHGKEQPEYCTEELKIILEKTHSQCVYQEQMLRICTDIAGFSLGKADNARRSCGKKLPEKMALLKDDFVNGCLNNNHSLEVANELWEIVLASAGYTFNASHAKGYTVTSMQCAWMKYYHPAQFFAALMSGQSDLEKIAKYASLLKRYNLKLLPPDINNSDADFKPTTNGILYGLAVIQGLGDGALEKILTARVNAPFESLIDFMLRTNVSSAIAETLIKAGAFDNLHNNRASLLGSVPIISKWISGRKTFVKKEQNTLAIPGINWDECLSYPSLIECSELPTNELLVLEKEAIGLSLSGHPLDDWMIEAEYLGNLQVNQLINGVVLVKSSRYASTKKGEPMMFATIEDCEGNTLDVTLFGVNCQCFSRYFKPGAVLNISGKVQVYNEKFSMVVDGAYQVSLERMSA